MRALIRTTIAAFLLASTTMVFAADVGEVFGAAAVDNLRDVRRLVQGRAVDPKAVDARGDTLLIVAIRNDAARVTSYLIDEKSTDLDASNASKETAMMIAAYRKKKDVVEHLIKRGAEVNRTGWTPLHYAASVDAKDIVAVLLEDSAYIDAESPNKTTPLMMAARSGFDDLCHQLVDAGADPTPVNERGITASDYARRAHSDALATWLDGRVVAWRAKYGRPVADGPLHRN